MVLLFYTTYISVDLAHHEIFHAKVGKGGINDTKQANSYIAGTFRAIKILELSIASTVTFPITGRVKEHILRI